MQAIGRARGAGKTHELITKHFLPTRAFLLVQSEQEKKRIAELYHLSPEAQKRIISWDHAKEQLAGRPHADILVDNVDMLLQCLFHQNPVAVTFTGHSG